MKIYFKYVLFKFSLIIAIVNSDAQNLNNFDLEYPEFKAYFIYDDLVIKPEETFFNLLTVINNSERPQVVIVDFNAPVGWTVIKEERRNYTIDGGDSLLIPIRVAATREVKGEIGYSIIASVNDRDGHSLANAYCYIKIPGKSDLRFRPITRVSYFDQESLDGQISFRIENRGNINEIISISLISTDNVLLPNERDNRLAFDLNIESGVDTVVTIPVKLLDDNNHTGQYLYRVDLEANTEITRFSTTFWFRHLTDYFKHEIPPGEIPLTAEFIIHNLFSEYSPYFSGSIMGNILFSGNRDINYRFRSYGIGQTDDILNRSRFRVAYNAPHYNAVIGDVAGVPIKYGFGRGFQVNYRFLNRYELTGVAAENQFRPIRNYGGAFDAKMNYFNLHTRFAYSDNEFFDNEVKIYGAGTNLSLFNTHNISIDGGLSDVYYKTVGHQEIGYGVRVNYTGRINNLRIRLNEQYGTANYYGRYAGRHNFMGSLRYPYKDNLLFDLYVYDRNYMPVLETSTGITTDKFNRSTRVTFQTTRYMDAGYSLLFGPIFERQGSNAFFHFDEQDAFFTNNARISIGARIRENQYEYFNPSLELGYSTVASYSEPGDEFHVSNLESRTEFFNAHFSLNMRRRTWGTFLNYFYGPYGLHQQTNYFYRNLYTQNIRIMPYYENFIYNDVVMLSSRLNFIHDFTYKTTRVHMQNELNFLFSRGFTVTLLNTLSYQVTTDLITEDKYDYSNTYFEIRLKKDFQWNQPRVKYHDLTVTLFKDLNGNLKKDPNEPGISNILVTIHREDPRYYDEFEKEYDYTGQLVNNQLLSGMDGTVRYKNLAAGLYRIEINNIDPKNGIFQPDVREMVIHVNKDKNIYIPFLERNKIFGQVILNRSRLSTLGRLDVSNIRVTATDTRGNTISTLTDAQGRFEIYAPSLDDYVVSIRDVFEEHFNLRQNDFIVHLNAYKQFEVNFVFDERRRRIDFHPGDITPDADIVRVRRTNLSGYVKDRTTLQPLRATVEIVDNQTGRTIESTRSERNTGRYNTSFMTGENYSLIVTATGYWMHSERLDLDQTLTIQDVEIEILLENIIVGSKFELRNLVFTPGSAEIPVEAEPELDRLVEQLKENPNVRIQIAGHSDGLETIDHRDISVRRAEAVSRYMFEKGFGNIEYVGYEDRRPIAPDDTEANRARNRRVEITIIDK